MKTAIFTVLILFCSGCAVSCEVARPEQDDPSNQVLAEALQHHAAALTNVLKRVDALEGENDT